MNTFKKLSLHVVILAGLAAIGVAGAALASGPPIDSYQDRPIVTPYHQVVDVRAPAQVSVSSAFPKVPAKVQASRAHVATAYALPIAVDQAIQRARYASLVRTEFALNAAVWRGRPELQRFIEA